MNARLDADRAAAARRTAVAGTGAPAPLFRVILRVAPGVSVAELRAAYPSAVFGSQAGAIVTASAPDAVLTAFETDARVISVQAARVLKPTLDVVRSNQTSGGFYLGTTINGAAADLANIDGTGVVVGVVDSGIDYRHADFVSGGVSRIKYLWDQTDAAGAPGVVQSRVACASDCGTEWTNAQLNSSLGTGSPVRERDTNGHGTHVTGIAAGNGNANGGPFPAGTFKGMAPKADIVFVKTDFTDAGILDGVNYIVARAADLGERAVINLSLGSQIDPHDGTSNFDAGIGAVAATTPIVVAMGNDGNAAPHAQAASMSFNQTITYAVSVGAGAGTDAEIDLWGASSDNYSVTVTLPGNTCPGMTEASGGVTSTPFSCAGNSVYINNAGAGSGSTSASDREMYVDVFNSSPLTITSINVAVTCTKAGGCGRLDGFVFPSSEGTAFATGVGYTVPQTLTMAAPATANNVFSVGSYASKISWTDLAGAGIGYTNGQALGAISDFSSWGPTRDGRAKPDVAAPGEGVGSSMSADASFDARLVLQDNKHVIDQGTSMAAPVVTGILASRLQGFPSRTVAQLRAILQGAARSDAAVTGFGAPPNSVFGYGKVVASPQPTGAPTGLSATALGVSSISWSWNSTLVSADAYDVFYASQTAQPLALAVQSPFIQTGLLGNATYGIFLRGEGGGIDGPGTFITSATYAAAPSGAPSATGFTSTATVTYSLCTAPPDPASCSGYVVQASTAANFTGTIFSSATANRALGTLKLSGLAASTNYAVRLGALNPNGGVTWSPTPSSFNTGTSLVAPTSPTFDQITTGSIRFNWAQGGNPGGLTYLAQASTASNYTGTVLAQSGTALNAVFTGLSSDTSWYFRVQALGGPFLSAGPAATLSLPPGVSTAPFLAVGPSSLTAAWTNPNQPDSLYKADLATDPGFLSVVQTAYVRTGAAAFAGLTPNTMYYARATAVSRSAAASASVVTGSTATLVQTPALPAQPFSSLATGGFTFSYLSGGNPAGVNYYVQVSTSPGFSPIAATAQTTSLSASFSGLESNRFYYAEVAGVNAAGTRTAFVSASTATAVAAPAAASVAVTTRTASSFGFAWAAGSLAAGTSYSAQVSSSPSFAFSLSSVVTAASSATLSGLQLNTTYYARVQAMSVSSDPDGPFLSAASGSTLAAPPTAAGTAFTEISFTSVTVHWVPLPLSPQSAAAEGYRVELSSIASFSSVSAVSLAPPGASSAVVSGLTIGTTYYARVGSLNWESLPSYLWVPGAAQTILPALSSGTQTSSGLSLSVDPGTPGLTRIRVDIPPGAFPAGTAVSAVTSVGVSVVGAKSNEAAALTQFGPATAFDLNAGGVQPAAPIRLTIAYDPTQIPAGQDERRLHLWRYDPGSNQWTFVPSQADPATHTLTASVQHFSSFAPFFVTAGTDLGAVQVFPQPWEIGDAQSQYWATTLTFSGLPAGARVRLFTVTGELVQDGTASAGGVYSWDGTNKFGRRAASGTYVGVIESAGAKLIRRVVVIR